MKCIVLLALGLVLGTLSGCAGNGDGGAQPTVSVTAEEGQPTGSKSDPGETDENATVGATLSVPIGN